MGAFKEPHGGELKELYLNEAAAEEAKQAAGEYQNWDLTDRQLCDIELILNGAFSPLEGFLTKAEYDSVLDDMRLPSGVLWPMPITLDVSEEFAGELEVGGHITLRDPEGVALAVLDIEDLWTPDRAHEAREVFGTEDDTHPVTKERIHNMLEFVETTSGWYEQISDMPTSTLRKLMKLGRKITKLVS